MPWWWLRTRQVSFRKNTGVKTSCWLVFFLFCFFVGMILSTNLTKLIFFGVRYSPTCLDLGMFSVITWSISGDSRVTKMDEWPVGPVTTMADGEQTIVQYFSLLYSFYTSWYQSWYIMISIMILYKYIMNGKEHMLFPPMAHLSSSWIIYCVFFPQQKNRLMNPMRYSCM